MNLTFIHGVNMPSSFCRWSLDDRLIYFIIMVWATFACYTRKASISNNSRPYYPNIVTTKTLYALLIIVQCRV